MPQCTSELLNEQNFLAARLTLAFGWTFFGELMRMACVRICWLMT